MYLNKLKMGRLFVVRYMTETKIYRSESSFLRATSSRAHRNGGIPVEIYETKLISEGLLQDVVNSIKTSRNRETKINSLTNDDIKPLVEIKGKYEELALDGYHKKRLVLALSNCYDLKTLKSIISNNKREFISIDNYDWYCLILKVNNFRTGLSTENYIKAKETLKASKSK